jgi:hypothetical protein
MGTIAVATVRSRSQSTSLILLLPESAYGLERLPTPAKEKHTCRGVIRSNLVGRLPKVVVGLFVSSELYPL